MNNNNFLKVMLLALAAIYVVSPLDLAPGPIDDLLLILFTIASNNRRAGRKILPPSDKDTIDL